MHVKHFFSVACDPEKETGCSKFNSKFILLLYLILKLAEMTERMQENTEG